MEMYEHDSLYCVLLQIIRYHYHSTHTMFDKIGVYPGQPPMLIMLSHKDGLSQKELSEKLKVKPATITVMLKRMEKVGLVKRSADEEDQRIIRVHLTQQGRELANEVAEIMKFMGAECFENLSEEEKVILRRLLMVVRDNLKKEFDKSLSG